MKLKLLKIRVQPVCVKEAEDGAIEELELPVAEIPVADWPGFAKGKLERNIAELEKQMNEAAAKKPKRKPRARRQGGRSKPRK